MKGSTIFFFLLVLLTHSRANGQEKNYLVRFQLSPDEELYGGYLNQDGDTIVPYGKYYMAFTDKSFYFVTVVDTLGYWWALDLQGNVMYEIYFFDNGPDYIEEGLFRIVINDKIGYANFKGEIVIPPKYACAFPFNKGVARVAIDCELITTDEHTSATSQKWMYIDKLGKKIKKKK